MVVLVALTGCSTTGLMSGLTHSSRKPFVKATASNPAVKCLCVWQTADGYDPEGKPCRGVAGQVFFFNRDSAVPVVVNGDLRVFVFDDQCSEADKAKPLNQFDIDPHTWNQQLIRTQFGPAYRLFVPYTRRGRHEAQLAIRLRLTPDRGPAVFSDLAAIDLSGYKPDTLTTAAATQGSPTAVRVDQTLREHLAGHDAADSRTERAIADALPKPTAQTLALRPTAHTIATLRTAARTED